MAGGIARRRSDQARAVEKMRRIIHDAWLETRESRLSAPPRPFNGGMGRDDALALFDLMAKRWAGNRKKCGCSMCSTRRGVPRDLTPGELRAPRADDGGW